MTDYDSPWKEAIGRFVELFLAFFFPQAHADIDWSRGYELLDKELQKVVRDAQLGRRWADLLVKVWLKNGREAWVYIHVEVQSQEEEDFPRRMYVYNYRLFDRYNQMVVSLAVLGDDRPDWRPDRFNQSLWGCSVGIQFPIVKLLDYATKEAELEANPNPFAAVVLAHLKTRETRQDPEARRTWKVRLVKGLYRRGLSRQDVLDLFRLIDWMMELPEELDKGFWQELNQIEEEQHMRYVTSVERLGRGREGRQEGRQEGRREGLLEGIELGLKLRFGKEGLQLLPEVRRLTDLKKVRAFHKAIETASLDRLRQRLAKGTPRKP